MRRAISRLTVLAAFAAGAAWGQGLTVTCTPATLPEVVGSATQISCSSTGGVAPYTWSIATGGALPPGLTQNQSTGAITGTLQDPAGPYSFTVVATDSTPVTPLTGSQPYSGTTVNPLTATCTPPTGPVEVGVAYTDTCTASGGTPPYSWSLSGPSVPAGLTISSTGAIKYTPTAAGAYQYQATATDSSPTVMTKSVTFSGTIAPAVAILTASPLPTADAGSLYSQQFAVVQGTGVSPFGWTATGLPSGITMSATGLLQGIPPSAGTVTFTAMVTDGAGGAASGQFSFTVNQPLTIATSSPLAGGAVSASYDQTLTGTGGAVPYSWSLATGSQLPSGLLLISTNSTGVINGTPQTAGTFTFTVQMTDSLSYTTSKQFAITISGQLAITTTSLPNATVGVPYNQSLTATGGAPPIAYAWTPVGPLPAPLASLSLSAQGSITGTPTAAAPQTSFQVAVADQGTQVTATLKLTIVTPPVISTPSPLPNGTTGVNYSQTISASGGTPPYTWTVLSGSLPGGLTLGSTTGTISGKPSAAGPFNFTMQLTDSTGVTTSQPFALTIVAGLSISTPSTLPTGEVNIAYTENFSATGGSGTYSWSVIGGTPPPGLTLSPAGALTGTPNTAGSYSFMVQATDTNNLTASAPFSLTIASAVGISTASGLSGGVVGSSYSVSLAASAGVAPYTWRLIFGSLPPGLALSSAGVLAGTPIQTGTFTFTLAVTDSRGGTASGQFTVIIATGLTITSPAILPGGTPNTPYSYLFTAAGGTAPYTWTVPSGSLPSGVTIASNGQLSGQPTAAGTYHFTVQVTDSLERQALAQESLTISSALTIVTTTLAGAALNVSYSQTLTASGGTPPYTWSLATGSGPLPTGLSLTSAGLITGTPTSAGTFMFTVLVTDSASVTETQQLSITVTAGLMITTAAALNATLNTTYTETLAASGGKAPYTWAITSGALPGGLTLSAAGVITGTPNAPGTFTFTVTVTDSSSATASLPFTLVVSGLAITTTSLPGGKVGTPYSQALTASGGTAPYTFSLSSGTLPPGITLSGNALSGTPSKVGSYTFTIQVTDHASLTATQQFTIAITGLIITTPALPSAAVGTVYSETLAASGTAPYTWVIAQGSLPNGLTLDTSTGVISGTASAAGTSGLTIQVTDSTGAVATEAVTLRVISASFSGLTATPSSGEQVSFTLALGAAYPQEITGQVTLAFQPDSSLASPYDDPAIQFSTGGTSASFTIPASSTAPVSFSLQSGTVAGTITLAVSWQAGGATLAVPAALTQSITIDTAAPSITGVTASTTSSGFSVVVTGYSNTRDLSKAVLQFTPASGQTLTTTSLTISLSNVASTWFAGSSSDQYGGQFVLTLPFMVSTGSASAIGSVSVQLVNSTGTSSSASASF